MRTANSRPGAGARAQAAPRYPQWKSHWRWSRKCCARGGDGEERGSAGAVPKPARAPSAKPAVDDFFRAHTSACSLAKPMPHAATICTAIKGVACSSRATICRASPIHSCGGKCFVFGVWRVILPKPQTPIEAATAFIAAFVLPASAVTFGTTNSCSSFETPSTYTRSPLHEVVTQVCPARQSPLSFAPRPSAPFSLPPFR